MNSEILATAFSEVGHDVRLVTWTQDQDKKDYKFLLYRNPGISTLFKLHNWAELVFENNPSLRLSWPALFFLRPRVVAVRTWISRKNGNSGIQDVLKKFWLKKSRKVIAVSEAIRKQSFASAVVIGNPYRVEQFKILPEVPRSRDFVYLGRLVSDKGVDQAIMAVHHLNLGMTEKYHLSIVGDGPEKNNLESLVRDFEMEEFVCFTGALQGKELTTCLNGHRYMLIPSLWEEPFGNVALEGMACGCIPIVSNGGGLPDAVGDAGLIFERGNLQNLIEVMEKLIGEPQLQVRLQQESIKHLARHHPETISRQYLKLIEDAFTENKKVLT